MTDATERRGPHRLDAVVHGRVHGVGFRAYALRVARENALRGWVANEAGGRVHLVAEGEPRALHALVQAVRVGPPAALVDRVDETWSPATGEFRSFEIRSGWHGGD
ncbi:MAG TPA: acylphosphatase [Candidatus Limnocylindrales bacterium]|nr:acylphosphatase [Candidatus Limnocylindrales bacterium]